MSGLGALVLGAAFWPAAAVQRHLAVRLTFAEELSEADRQAKLAEVEATVGSEAERCLWAAEADATGKPKPFVFAKLAGFLLTAVRAEATLAASPIETDGKLTGVEVTFSDSDGLRAERFAQAIARSFDDPATELAGESPAAPIASDAEKTGERAEALASIRREQDRLQKALDEHFKELRSLRSELSGESAVEKKDAHKKKSTAAIVPSNVAPLSISLRTPSLKHVLWQVSPGLSSADIERRIAELAADIAAKKAAREELLSKFTAHHPVASALGVAIERLERERRDLEQLLGPANQPLPSPSAQASAPRPASSPQAIPQPTAPRQNVTPPAARPTVAPAPAAPRTVPQANPFAPVPSATAPVRIAPPTSTVASEATASPAADVRRAEEAAKKAAAEEIAANKKAVAEALERALRSEEALKHELRSLAEASNALALDSPVAAPAARLMTTDRVASEPSVVHASIVDLAESDSVENRFALLLAGSLLFACLMTGLTWTVSRERAVGSAEEVRLASGLPVVGQSTAGLLDRKPKRNLASIAVSSSLAVVEGAAFATAVFCVAALAAENPRCEQILRQPLAVAWQALQSLT